MADMTLPADLDQLNADELRRLLLEKDRELAWRQAKIDKLTHELAIYKRQRYGVKTERLPVEQAHLFDETVDADLAAMAEELEQLSPTPDKAKGQAKRKPLPAELPRTEIHHEPESTVCGCGCTMQRIGEDVAEKLDYAPGTFTVERHIRGKWVCGHCETLIQAPVPAQVIDKGIPTAGLLAHVLIAKYLDHLPLYRQEAIFGRVGLAIPQSTLAQWVGQTGVALQPLVDALKEALLAHPVLQADNAGGDARPRGRQDASRLPLVLQHRRLRADEGGGI
jgi:transposase